MPSSDCCGKPVRRRWERIREAALLMVWRIVVVVVERRLEEECILEPGHNNED
jgi:hypothetical protein